MKSYQREIGVLVLLATTLAGVVGIGGHLYLNRKQELSEPAPAQPQEVQQARIVANGDILYHDLLYTSARQEDGTYEVNPYFEEVKPWIEGADLAIGDYEGTISPDFPLAGYPLFNAPIETAESMKAVGYDVVDLGHNHILDSQLSGAIQTARTFKELGLTPIGFYEKGREEDGLIIKEVNGIKIALLAYAYGFNGMEGNLTPEEYDRHMADLDEDKIKDDLEAAEAQADVTVVMPQMGEEYALEPNQDQQTLYRKMVDWGADVVLGGHPHVIQPAEVLDKDGEKKFIIYSMGNFLSNQRLETLDNIWTERGVLMDVVFEKVGDRTIIKTVQAHPTMVRAWGKGSFSPEGYEYMDYRVMVLEDFIEGGSLRERLTEDMKARVDLAYQEITDLVALKW